MKKKLLRWTAVMLLVLGTLITLFYAVENWRGARAWEILETELRQRNEPMTPDEILPVAVPDSSNGALLPIWKEIFESEEATEKGIIDGSKPRISGLFFKFKPNRQTQLRKGWAYDITLPIQSYATDSPEKSAFEWTEERKVLAEEVVVSLNQAFFRWPLQYGDFYLMKTPQYGELRDTAAFFQLRSVAFLDKGKSDMAYQDVRILVGLANTTKDTPFLISRLTRLSLEQVVVETIWEGLLRHAWNAEQLKEMDGLLEDFQPLTEARRGYGEERVSFVQMQLIVDSDVSKTISSLYYEQKNVSNVEHLITLLYFKLRPEGWRNQERVLAAEETLKTQDWLQTTIEQGAIPSSLESLAPELFVRSKGFWAQTLFIAGRIKKPLATGAMQGISQQCGKFVEMQVLLTQCRTAIAIERFRMDQKRLPSSLDELVPHYSSQVPLDIWNGKAMTYVAKDEKTYVLYAVGWNGTDDGGYTSKVTKKGDWVWPSKPGLVEVRDK